MGGSDRGYHDTPYFAGAELALEPQDFPDAPQHPHFPSIEITPEHPYRQITECWFGIRR